MDKVKRLEDRVDVLEEKVLRLNIWRKGVVEFHSIYDAPKTATEIEKELNEKERVKDALLCVGLKGWDGCHGFQEFQKYDESYQILKKFVEEHL